MDTIKSASGITESVPMTGVGQQSSVSLDISGGDAKINTVSDADVGVVPAPTARDGMATVCHVLVDEGESGNIQSATT